LSFRGSIEGKSVFYLTDTYETDVEQDAYAAGGEYGILEGRILSLLHPVVMLILFFATGYAGFLG